MSDAMARSYGRHVKTMSSILGPTLRPLLSESPSDSVHSTQQHTRIRMSQPIRGRSVGSWPMRGRDWASFLKNSSNSVVTEVWLYRLEVRGASAMANQRQAPDTYWPMRGWSEDWEDSFHSWPASQSAHHTFYFVLLLWMNRYTSYHTGRSRYQEGGFIVFHRERTIPMFNAFTIHVYYIC